MYDSENDNKDYDQDDDNDNKRNLVEKSIVYKKKITEGFKMAISQDFMKVLFANQDENYILETIIDKKD